jgi:hypothetical protein
LNEKIESLGKKGNALKVTANEHQKLADKVSHCIKELEDMSNK